MKTLYFRLAILASAALLIHGQAFSQTYKMTDGQTINTCAGTFYDDGGPSSNYQDNKVMTETFCSCNGSPIKFTFTAFNTEPGYDSLIVYNGTNILAPKLGAYHGPVNPGVIVSSNAGNCLTFFFQSDLNTNAMGWAADISCTGSTATITASGPTTFCPGNDVTLTASAGSGYSWSTGSSAQSIVASTAGTYYVAIGSGTCTASAPPVTVSVKSSPTVTATGAATICAGASTSLKATGAASYSWAPPASLTNSTISNPYASPTSTTTYSVTGTAANSCTALATVKITVKAQPNASIGGNTSICQGDATTLTASGGGTYVWNTGQTTTEIVVSPPATINYSVLVTGTNGCKAGASTGVEVNPLPATPTVTANMTTLSSSAAASYQWYYNSNAISGETGQSLTVMQNGTYMVCVTDANGCSSCSQGYNFNVTGINDGISAIPMISPNPTRGKLMVEVPGVIIFSFRIINHLGETVLEQNDIASSKAILDLTDQPVGIYFLTLETPVGTSCQKVVVNR